jgi:carbon monoxide dehydrogenase subunit G
MASIHKEFRVKANPKAVWQAVCDVGNVHKVLVPGVLTDARLDGDARVVTFANGMVVREIIVDLDHKARRFAYAAIEGGITTHHNASWQVFDDGAEGTRFVWISDFLPNSATAPIQALVDQGSEVMRQTLEAQLGKPTGS